MTRHESMTALVGTVVHVDNEGLRPSTTTRALALSSMLTARPTVLSVVTVDDNEAEAIASTTLLALSSMC